MNDPPATSTLNDQLRDIVRRSRRVLWMVIASQGAVLLAVCILSGYLAWRQLSEGERVQQIVTRGESSQCDFYYVLGTIDISGQMTTKTAVSVIETSRRTISRLGCHARLPAPSKGLLQAGKKYGIQITR